MAIPTDTGARPNDVDNTDESRLIIEGISPEGNKKFRPSDWIDRIATLIAGFGADHRLRYSKYVHPCVIEGRRCLVVVKHLNERDPDFYAFIIHFATQNKLQIREDRRETRVPVETERRREVQTLDELITPLAAGSGSGG